MTPYSQELRARMLDALAAGEAPHPALAERFGVRLAFVETLWRRLRRSGSGAAKPHAGGKPRALADHPDLLRRERAPQADATLEAWRGGGAATEGPGGRAGATRRGRPPRQPPPKKR